MRAKEMVRWTFLINIIVILLSGCATKVKQDASKTLSVCSSNKCFPAAEKYSSTELFEKLSLLIKGSEGQTIDICDADPKTNQCKTNAVCYFVLGGIIPAKGCAQHLVFSEIKAGDKPNQLSMKTDMPLTFIGTHVNCKSAVANLVMNSATDISLVLDSYYCNWMILGNMMAQFSFTVDSIDFDHNQINGYWAHSVKGTGNGSGSGYAIFKLPSDIK